MYHVSRKKRILFIPPSLLGDSILASSLLNWVLNKYPTAEVTIACSAYTQTLFRSVKNLKTCIIIERKFLSLHWLLLFFKLAFMPWHTIINLRGSPITYLFLRRKHIFQSKARKDCHRVLNYASLVNEFSPPPPPFVWRNTRDYEEANQLLAPIKERGKPIIALAPIAGTHLKSAPLYLWKNLLDHVTDSQKGLLKEASIVLLGQTREQPQIQPLIPSLPQEQTFDLTGNLPLSTLAALLESCTLFLGNDSGVTHLAAAVGTPTLAIFSVTPAFYYHPWGERVCYIEPIVPSQMFITSSCLIPEEGFAGKILRKKVHTSLLKNSIHKQANPRNPFETVSVIEVTARIATLLGKDTSEPTK